MQQTCVQQYVFMSTEMYHVVLCMVNAIKKDAKYILCVPMILVLWIVVKYTHVNSLCYLRPLYQNFMRNTTLQIYINWNFICHMCVFWGHKTMEKSAVRPLNAEANIMTYYAGVIMLKYLYPVLHNKCNIDTMVEICVYLLKALY